MALARIVHRRSANTNTPRTPTCVVDRSMDWEAYSGGGPAKNIIDLDEFSKSLSTRVDVPGTTFGLLAKVPLLQAQEYAIACVKAMMCTPQQWCSKHMESKLLTSSDITDITGKLKPQAVRTAKITWSCPTIGHPEKSCATVARLGLASDFGFVYLCIF